MNRTLIAVLSLSLLSVPLAAHDHHDHGDAKKAGAKPAKAAEGAVTLSGEVVDMACFLGHETKGEKHMKCAKDCVVKKAAPAGLLTDDGALYLLVEDHAQAKPYDAAKKLAGEQAKVSGRMVKRGGMQALVVSEAVAR